MKSDEEFSDMLDKTILIDCLNENVIILNSKQNSKRAVFTALFFYEPVIRFGNVKKI